MLQKIGQIDLQMRSGYQLTLQLESLATCLMTMQQTNRTRCYHSPDGESVRISARSKQERQEKGKRKKTKFENRNIS